jgi:hypothetical protein
MSDIQGRKHVIDNIDEYIVTNAGCFVFSLDVCRVYLKILRTRFQNFVNINIKIKPYLFVQTQVKSFLKYIMRTEDGDNA